jgi:hypothetical protein
MQILDESVWRPIQGFQDYAVNDQGKVIRIATMKEIKPSFNNSEILKVNLVDDRGERRTKSVRSIVAEAFLDRSQHEDFTTVIQKDLDPLNVCVENLEWRSRKLAMLYSTQFNIIVTQNSQTPVIERTTNTMFDSVVDAARTYGLLFKDIWNSINDGEEVWTTGHLFDTTN